MLNSKLDDSINKFLTEAMGELKENPYTRDLYWIDFSTWEGFGILLSWAKKQTWWYSFIGISSDGLGHDDWEGLDIDLVNPMAFAIAVYDELKG